MIFVDIYGTQHPYVEASLDNLAVDYRKLAEHNEAKECEETSLMIKTKVYNEKHPNVGKSYSQISC